MVIKAACLSKKGCCAWWGKLAGVGRRLWPGKGCPISPQHVFNNQTIERSKDRTAVFDGVPCLVCCSSWRAMGATRNYSHVPLPSPLFSIGISAQCRDSYITLLRWPPSRGKAVKMGKSHPVMLWFATAMSLLGSLQFGGLWLICADQRGNSSGGCSLPCHFSVELQQVQTCPSTRAKLAALLNTPYQGSWCTNWPHQALMS